ncbi:chemotaxis-specific methylesterase, partial [Pseudomonas savastanoi pv. glycinea str. race 4]
AACTAPAAHAHHAPAHPTTSGTPKRKAYKLVAIGTSTGGPVALQRVITQFP